MNALIDAQTARLRIALLNRVSVWIQRTAVSQKERKTKIRTARSSSWQRGCINIVVAVFAAFRFASAAATVDLPTYPRQFERQANVIGDGCVDFRWTYDEEASNIVFSARSAPGASWLGIGISEFGSMKGADIVMVQWNGLENNFLHFDRFSHDFVLPKDDILQNYELLHASRDEEDRIHAVVRRDADTCDLEDLPVTGAKQNLICASGDLDPSGTPIYHGLQRGKTLTNIVVDEDLIISRRLEFPIDGRATELVPELVTEHTDHKTAVAPFPVDIQLPLMALDPTERTVYRCVAFTMPIHLRVVSWEAVWGDGVTEDDERPPTWLHHQDLRYCELPDQMLTDAQRLDEPFDCYNRVPSCETQIGHAQNGVIELPPAAHLHLKGGEIYILLAHYENHFGVDLGDQRPGIRVWTEPPRIEPASLPGRVSYLLAHFDSIDIPPDPKQEEYEIQFMISSDATKAVLPDAGIQIVGSHLHMHEAGIKGNVQLVRDSVHIRNVYEVTGYDFALQTPKYELWKLLPGDSLIISCTFRPDTNRHIKGGWSTNDEMCELIFFLVGPNGNFVHGLGWAVRPDQPFEKSFMGSNFIGGHRSIQLSNFTYAPNREQRGYASLDDHRLNVCEAVVGNKVQRCPVTWHDPAISAQIYLMVSFLAFHGIRFLLGYVEKKDLGERKRRNTAVYIVQMLYGMVTLPIILMTLVDTFLPSSSFNAADPETWPVVRAFIVGQSILFLAELFYRIDIRIELVAHHLLASGLVVFLNWINNEFWAIEICLKLGCALTLFAVTEPLNYLYLILRNLGYGDTKWGMELGYWSGWFYIASKLAVGGISFYILSQIKNEEERSFDVREGSFGEWLSSSAPVSVNFVIGLTAFLVTSLMIVQVYVGTVFLKLSKQKLPSEKDDDVDVGSQNEKEKFHGDVVSVSNSDGNTAQWARERRSLTTSQALWISQSDII